MSLEISTWQEGAMQLSKVAQEALRKAEAIRNYWDAELPRRHPDYPLVNPGKTPGRRRRRKGSCGRSLPGYRPSWSTSSS